ncbi:MAG TPA: 16S rRNA (cytidine(1402)-2'-O)-methyltransferase [Glaciecola sp.]|jgi:16S rRNA (cytidine1402-2'-O)-methyltransferase|nr:16S rRNA (cytidine(1402)-2'-O)-methyltransferase [Glaciecola sp.]HCF79624.1 16S rRNA (cytidine(1402)-2'-O)-methyltransferase [Glaciecola sp.]
MSDTGCLYIVPTPIGNLQDITLRALTILKSVDAIACEDTRHSRVLLQHFSIDKPTFAVHDHNESMMVNKVIQRLEKGESIALISDAGTPLISDPGYVLVHACREINANVIALPGPCAAVTALSGAGLPTDQFIFRGFLPVKQQAKQQAIEALQHSYCTSVFYEAPRRVLDTMKMMERCLPDTITIVMAKEITKTFETFISGSASKIIEWLEAEPAHQKGEFVLMVGPAEKDTSEISLEAQTLMRSLQSHLPPKKAAGIVAEHYGLKKNSIYQWSLMSLQTQ